MPIPGFAFRPADSWSTTSKQQFRRFGYVHFRELLPSALVSAAHAKVLRDVEEHFDPARLAEYNHRSWCPALRASPEIKRLFQNRSVQAIADEALGKERYGVDDGQIAIRQAHSASHPTEPVAHIDGIPTPQNGLAGGGILNFTGLLGVFLTEIKADFAGNFTVWPGSHLLLEEYFRGQEENSMEQGMPQIPLGEPIQLRCQPGDAVFCHYQLVHSAAVNTSAEDRIAVFFRLRLNELHGASRSTRWDYLTDIWRGWRI